MTRPRTRRLPTVLLKDDDLSDEELEHPRRRFGSISDEQFRLVKDIVDGDLKINFEDQQELENFREQYERCFTGGPQGTLIHVALRECREDEFEPLMPLFRFLVNEYPILLEAMNDVGETILHYAIQRHMGEVVAFLCACAPEEMAAQALSRRGPRGETCLHAALRLQVDPRAVGSLISMCDSDTLTVDSDDGHIPLHFAVRYLALPETRDEGGGSNSGQVLAAREPSVHAGDGSPSSPSSRLLPELHADEGPHYHADPHAVRALVSALIQKSPSGLLHYNWRHLTPYQERVALLQETITPEILEAAVPPEDFPADGGTEPDPESEFRKVVVEDPIAALMLDHCMKNFSRDDIMRCLYQPGEERQLEFDLSGFPHSTVSQKFFNQLSKHLKFESILQYVALPQLDVEPAMSPRNKGRAADKPIGRGRSDFVTIFNWLRRMGVRKIIRIMVVDDSQRPHSDSSIEEALRGFDVQVWDWKRPDLSTRVISNSTKRVKEMTLYSTGNHAVFMGWRHPDGGILDKRHFPELVKVLVFVQESLDGKNRLRADMQEFLLDIHQNASGRIVIDMSVDQSAASQAFAIRGSLGLIQTNLWFDSVMSLSRLLRTAPKVRGKECIKIAIIDDGVDASLDILSDKIASGRSFALDKDSTSLFSPYYIPTSKHGTLLATLVCSICPNASLYIARMDGLSPVERAEFRSSRAADAVRWATQCDVHIICMSWSTSENEKDLNAAIQEANAKDVVMFCSSSDDANTIGPSFPSHYRECITIGAASETGDPLGFISSYDVDFLLPGKNAPFSGMDREDIASFTGSSVATAVACGLAGLLLQCIWLTQDGSGKWNGMEIRRIFKGMAAGNKFVNAARFLRGDFMSALARSRAEDEVKSSAGPYYDLDELIWDDNVRSAFKRVLG